MNPKLLLSTTDPDGREKEVLCWTDAIYPQRVPLAYSQYVDLFLLLHEG